MEEPKINKTKYYLWGGALLLKGAGWLCTLGGVPVGPVTEAAGLSIIKGATVASLVVNTLTFAEEVWALADIATDTYTTFVNDVAVLCTAYKAALDLMEDFPQEITGELSIHALDPSDPQCTVDPPNIEPTSPWTAEVGADIWLRSPVTATGTILLEVIHKGEVLSTATFGGIDLEPNLTQYLMYTLPFPIPLLSYGDEAVLSVVCYAGIYGDEGAWISGPKTSLFKIAKPGAYSGHVVSNSVDGELGTGESFSLPLAIPDTASNLMVNLEYGGSELDVHLYDDQGGHVGMNYATGNTEIGIPGASYSGPKATHEWISLDGVESPHVTVEVVCVFSENTTDFSLSYLLTLDPPPAMHCTPKYSLFAAREGGENPESQTLTIYNFGAEGCAPLEWTVITVEAPGATNTPQQVPVFLYIQPSPSPLPFHVQRICSPLPWGWHCF